MSTTTTNTPSSDAIGETVYSKQWLIQCLMKLIKFIEKEQDNLSEDVDESLNIDNDGNGSIEEELCIVWDMSSNEDVQKYLSELDGHEIFANTVLKTKNPRLAEISIGILANLSHNKEISQAISMNEYFVENLLVLISASDVPFLTQLIRFLTTILHKNSDIWLSFIEKNGQEFFDQIEFMLNNCLNCELLKILLQFINDIFYLNDNLGKFWLQNDTEFKYVSGLNQATNQILSSLDIDVDNDYEMDGQFFYNYWFVLEMLTREDNPYVFDLKFLGQLFESKELFGRFKDFLNDSFNSAASFSAACSVFNRLIKRYVDSDNKKQEKEEMQKKIRENMSDNRIILSIFQKAKSMLSCEKFGDCPEEISLNILEFYDFLFPRSNEGNQ